MPVARTNEFCMLAPKIWWLSVWNWCRVMLPAPRILEQFSDFFGKKSVDPWSNISQNSARWTLSKSGCHYYPQVFDWQDDVWTPGTYCTWQWIKSQGLHPHMPAIKHTAPPIYRPREYRIKIWVLVPEHNSEWQTSSPDLKRRKLAPCFLGVVSLHCAILLCSLFKDPDADMSSFKKSSVFITKNLKWPCKRSN